MQDSQVQLLRTGLKKYLHPSGILLRVSTYENKLPVLASSIWKWSSCSDQVDIVLLSKFAAKLDVDGATGQSTGCGFVEYDTIEAAEKARKAMHCRFLDRWIISVEPAKE